MTPTEILDEIAELDRDDLEYFLNELRHQVRNQRIQLRWIDVTPRNEL